MRGSFDLSRAGTNEPIELSDRILACYHSTPVKFQLLVCQFGRKVIACRNSGLMRVISSVAFVAAADGSRKLDRHGAFAPQYDDLNSTGGGLSRAR